jgi:acyl dehydratase
VTRVLDGPDALRAAVGSALGTSSWITLHQRDFDAFAAVTGDDYFLHTDPARAALTPAGGTIAHGLLTLSLGPRCCYEIYRVDGVADARNYGYGRVRFPAPVPVGSRIRMHAALRSVEVSGEGLRVTVDQRFEREGTAKPVCVAEGLTWFRTA